MLRVYPASKLHHAQMWRDLCAVTPHIYLHARWLKHSAMGTPDTPENAAAFWLQDQEDVTSADILVVYAEPEDHLRGGLIEAGIALAHGIPVIVVGEHQDYGTWQYHPGVIRTGDMADTVGYLKRMARDNEKAARRAYSSRTF